MSQIDQITQAAAAIAALLSDRAKQSLMQGAVILVHQAIDRNTPWQSVRQLTRHQVISPTEARLENTHHAAEYLEEGTKAHTIRPRTARVLRFEAGGAVVFARVVHHPGTKATHFFTEGADSGEQAIEPYLNRWGQTLDVEIR